MAVANRRSPLKTFLKWDQVATAREETGTTGGLAVLWARREVALTSADLVTPVVAIEIDGTKGAIGFEVRRHIGQRILAAELFFNALKTGRHLFDRRREENLSAS